MGTGEVYVSNACLVFGYLHSIISQRLSSPFSEQKTRNSRIWSCISISHKDGWCYSNMQAKFHSSFLHQVSVYHCKQQMN